MLFARPVRRDDIDAVLGLKAMAGPGFTSLAVNDDIIAARIEKSVHSFSTAVDAPGEQAYILILEDSDTGEVCGMSAIKAQIGVKDPFFNFKILNVAQKSKVAGKRFDMEVLLLVNEYAGASEVGTLFVPARMRGTGAGRLVSQSRYMLMATDLQRFGGRTVSELRGTVDDNGKAPFWDAIGRKFFQMDFSEADHISAEQDNQFILDLMPKYPIYADLLPKAAQDAMGCVHAAGQGALRLLEQEGFRYDRVIDIFDGGPSVSAPTADIRTVRDSRVLPIKAAKKAGKKTTLLCNNRVEDFRTVMGNIDIENGEAYLTPDLLNALKLDTGDTVRLWVKS